MATDREDVKKSVFVQNRPSPTNINTLIYIQNRMFLFQVSCCKYLLQHQIKQKYVYVIHIKCIYGVQPKKYRKLFPRSKSGDPGPKS